jgi:outer membrane protein assembly factor BamB
MESREAFTTPMPYVHKGQKLILLAGGDLVSGHEAATGKELWRWGTWNEGHRTPHYRLVPSPVAGAGVVLGCGPKNEPVFAIKLGMSGDLGDAGVAWQSERRGTITTDVPTPLFYNNRFYVVSDLKRNITCLDPATGKALWATPLILPSNRVCWASPTAADGKIYVVSLRGEVVVVDADSGKILATNPMAEDEDEIRSSVAISRGNLFVRTNSHLYSIGK